MRKLRFVSLSVFGLGLMLENTFGMYFDKTSNTFKTRQGMSQNSSNRAVKNNERSDEGVVHLIEVSDSQITNLNSQVNWLTRQVQDLNGKMVSIFAKIEEQDLSLKECNVNLNSQIADLTEQVRDLNSKVSEQKRLIEASNSDLMTLLERRQEEQQQRLEDQEKEQNAQIADLVKQMQDLNSKMSSIYEEMGEQKQLTETFNSNLKNLMEKQEERERLEKEEQLRLEVAKKQEEARRAEEVAAAEEADRLKKEEAREKAGKGTKSEARRAILGI